MGKKDRFYEERMFYCSACGTPLVIKQIKRLNTLGGFEWYCNYCQKLVIVVTEKHKQIKPPSVPEMYKILLRYLRIK